MKNLRKIKIIGQKASLFFKIVHFKIDTVKINNILYNTVFYIYII
jgi:hypothetical protein